MAVDEVNEILGADLPTGDWDTIGGLVLAVSGHVPSEGESVEVDGHLLVAEKLQGRRIGSVRIVRLEGPPTARRAPEPGRGMVGRAGPAGAGTRRTQRLTLRSTGQARQERTGRRGHRRAVRTEKHRPTGRRREPPVKRPPSEGKLAP